MSYIIMLEGDLENLNNIDLVDLKPRMRAYHLRIKQKKSEFEDYELRKPYFTQERPSGKEDSER